MCPRTLQMPAHRGAKVRERTKHEDPQHLKHLQIGYAFDLPTKHSYTRLAVMTPTPKVTPHSRSPTLQAHWQGGWLAVDRVMVRGNASGASVI